VTWPGKLWALFPAADLSLTKDHVTWPGKLWALFPAADLSLTKDHVTWPETLGFVSGSDRIGLFQVAPDSLYSALLLTKVHRTEVLSYIVICDGYILRVKLMAVVV
jgi:hypothetical protein